MTAAAAKDRPLLLLPPSKGKAAGGDGQPYGEALDQDHPLAIPRRALVEALLADLPTLDDISLARVAGVRRQDVDAARADLRGVLTAATYPAHRRYTGIVHGNAGLAQVDPAQLGIEVVIVSALAGLADLSDPLPRYRLGFGASLPSIGGIGTWWRAQLAEYLGAIVPGRRVWDLLPAEHARMWDPQVRRTADVTAVAFTRPDGGAANAARTKVCKGRLTAFLLAHPTAGAGEVVAEADPGEGWTLTVDGADLRATYTP